MKDNKGPSRNVRVLKKNMIFLQSYDDQITNSTLRQSSTFTPAGKVESVKTKQNYRNTTTYVTYADQQSAATALVSFSHLSSRLRVLFGTVQYCKYFMRKAECRNDDCVFQHVRDKKNQIIVNDQIDQAVYDDHYDMALNVLEDHDYNPLRQLLQNTSIDENTLLKQGAVKAAEALGIEPIPPPLNHHKNGKQSQFLSQSTQDGDLIDSRDQNFERSSSHSQAVKEEQVLNIREMDSQDYLKIRLIKKLLRENNSKRHSVSDLQLQQGQIHQKSKMMLYQIVRY